MYFLFFPFNIFSAHVSRLCHTLRVLPLCTHFQAFFKVYTKNVTICGDEYPQKIPNRSEMTFKDRQEEKI